jgi:hypothetical protein
MTCRKMTSPSDMRQISNADYSSVLRLLDSLSRKQGTTVREKEDARKAALLSKKLKRKALADIHK